ncbi:MAG: hypothetical protein ACR2IK_01520 [Chloroflexota bacterium]
MIRDNREACATFQPHLDAVAPLRREVRQSHAKLDELGVAGLANPHSSPAWSPAVGLYVHAMCVEDITIQLVLRDVAPLFTSFCPSLGNHVDRSALARYARAVQASTDAYLAELSSDGLSHLVDLGTLGLGRRTVAWVIRRFVIGELAHISGEMSGSTPGFVAQSIDPMFLQASRSRPFRSATGRVTHARLSG